MIKISDKLTAAGFDCMAALEAEKFIESKNNELLSTPL